MQIAIDLGDGAISRAAELVELAAGGYRVVYEVQSAGTCQLSVTA